MTAHQFANREIAYPAAMAYPRNHWYVAAFSREVHYGKPLRRVLLDKPVLLYRTEAGEPVALYDRCPHRGAPLSLGKQIGDEIQCGYHGIRYGKNGRCTHVPSQSGKPAAMAVESYPVVEKWKWIWIWLGDPAKADAKLIPDHDWLFLNDESLIATPFFTVELGCNYQIFHDNLLDSSHLSYVHFGTLDTGGIASSTYEVTEEGRSIVIRREEPAVSYEGGLAAFFGCKPGVMYHRTHTCEAFMPSIHIAKQYMRQVDDAGVPASLLCAINALTPRDARTTYVFHAMVSNYSGPEMPQSIEQARRIVTEDEVVVGAIQRDFDERGDTVEVSIASDKAGIFARRIIHRMIEAESGA